MTATKLSKGQQAAILLPVIQAYRDVGGRRETNGDYRFLADDYVSFCRALRLDDIKLALIIEVSELTGQKLEWTSEVPALCS